MHVRWMLLGLVMLTASLPVTAEEMSLELKAGKPSAAEFRLAAIRAFYKRNYEIWSIDPQRVTGRYKGAVKLEVVLQESAVIIRNATPGLLNDSNSRRYLNNLKRDLVCELAAYMITAPSSSELAGAVSTQSAAPTASGTAVSGTYVSSITTNGNYTFQKKSSRSIAITLEQEGTNITGSNSEYNLKLIGTLEGNTINFYTLPSKITSGEIKGEWVISDDANLLTGKWTRGAAGGIWNLTR